MADNKVTVRIYGQEYVISGERDPETIIEIAEYVDSKIKELVKLFGANATPGSIPVLAAVNIADEYFANKQDVDSYKAKIAQLEKDSDNYLKMWDEAKENFSQFKEGESRYEGEIKQLKDKINELEERCKEFEDSYFDAQMENIKLKDTLRKITGKSSASY